MTTVESVTPPEGMRLIHSSAVCSIGEIARTVVCVWHLQPTQDTFELRNRELKEIATRHPGACAYVDVIEPNSKAPPDALRKMAVQVFRDLDKDLTCIAFLVDGSELRSALTRSVLTTLTFLLPQVQPSKVFKSVDDAATWIRGRMGDDQTFNSQLASAVEFLRRPRRQGSSSAST